MTYEAIVIGVSAGGLQALTSLLEPLPPAYPLPIIIVQHRSKDEGALLAEVLQARCRITIKDADEKEAITAGMYTWRRRIITCWWKKTGIFR